MKNQRVEFKIHFKNASTKNDRSTERYGAAGNSVILQLAQGDRVWVAHTSGSVLWTLSNAPFSTFSGFRLG